MLLDDHFYWQKKAEAFRAMKVQSNSQPDEYDVLKLPLQLQGSR